MFSNYLEGNTGAIQIGNGGAEVADGAPLVSHDRPDDNVITFNTLVNNKRNYFMTGRAKGLGATRTVFASNVVQGGGPAASLDGPYSGGVWQGNIIWQTDGAGAMPAEAYDAVNPLLKADAKGVFRPQPRSPAIDGAKDHYGVALDMDGQPRTGRRDKGADEVSKAPVGAALLTPDDFFRLINDRR